MKKKKQCQVESVIGGRYKQKSSSTLVYPVTAVHIRGASCQPRPEIWEIAFDLSVPPVPFPYICFRQPRSRIESGCNE